MFDSDSDSLLTHWNYKSGEIKKVLSRAHVRSLGQIARNEHDQNEPTIAFVLIQVHDKNYTKVRPSLVRFISRDHRFHFESELKSDFLTGVQTCFEWTFYDINAFVAGG